MVGLNPTDHEIQALINEKEYDGRLNSQLLIRSDLVEILLLATVSMQCLNSINNCQFSFKINIKSCVFEKTQQLRCR